MASLRRVRFSGATWMRSCTTYTMPGSGGAGGRLVGADDLAVELDAQKALLLEEGVEIGWRRLCGHRNAKRHEHLLTGEVLQDMLDDGLRGLGLDGALALGAVRLCARVKKSFR